jgi:hypothetical protein
MTRMGSIGDFVSAFWEGRVRWNRMFTTIR